MTLTHVVTILSVIGFLITAAGLIGVSFRVGRNAQTVNNYRESADAWEMKAKAQADTIAECQARLAENDVTIRKLQDRVQILEEMVTGHTAITTLATDISNYFTSLQTHMDALADEIRKDLRGQHGR